MSRRSVHAHNAWLFLLCLLTSAIYAGDLQDLVSAANDFEVEMIKHEQVVGTKPICVRIGGEQAQVCESEERYFVELRKSVPTLIDMAIGKTPKTLA